MQLFSRVNILDSLHFFHMLMPTTYFLFLLYARARYCELSLSYNIKFCLYNVLELEGFGC